MADNNEVQVKRGETGFVLNAKMEADDGTLIDFSVGGDWAIAIKVTTRGASTTNLLQGSAMTLRNQITRPGEAYYVFTPTDAQIARGKYDLEITATDPLGRVHKFPKDAGKVFGTLYMVSSKG